MSGRGLFQKVRKLGATVVSLVFQLVECFCRHNEPEVRICVFEEALSKFVCFQLRQLGRP